MIEAGQVLQNRYKIERQIGEGGMGTVYIAVDQRFGTKVAIKETLFSDPNLRRAFEREAQLLNSLRHPALPRVSDHFTEGNGAFIVMEYIAGEDLSEMVERNGAFAVSDVLHWADVLLDALDYLHNQKFPVIHRDIKPQNLKLTPRGEIILLDFGLAKGSASELTDHSITKSIFGYSRSYAPLEQIQGTGTDPRSDLYSLAATLYHLLTGKPPVDALTRATAVLNGNGDPLHAAHSHNPKIPVSVSNLLRDAMALNANLRPQSAAKMRFALQEAIANPVKTEIDDSTTVISAAEVFTQNTQLMGDDAKTNKAENQPENGVKTNIVAAPNATETPMIPSETESGKSVGATNAQHFSSAFNRRASIAPLGIAAAVLLLGGGGFAAWYATNTKNAPAIEAPKTNVVSETTINANAETAETQMSNAGNNANAVGQTTTTQTAAKSDTKVVQPRTREQVKTNASKDSKTPADGETNEIIVVTVENMPEMENLDKEIDEAMKNARGKKPRLENIPPEILSNDPHNPIDREKLKIYIKKKYDEAMRRTREINRRRAEQGLPPIENPRPPKPRHIVRQPPPRN